MSHLYLVPRGTRACTRAGVAGPERRVFDAGRELALRTDVLAVGVRSRRDSRLGGPGRILGRSPVPVDDLSAVVPGPLPGRCVANRRRPLVVVAGPLPQSRKKQRDTLKRKTDD